MSFLVGMLHARVTPLSNIVAVNSTGKKNKGNPHPDNKQANLAKHRQAVARYKAVMGEDWTGTRTIECSLGYCRSAVLPNLNKWMAMGIVQRRKAGGEVSWNRMKGYEWRFAEDQT